MRLRFFSLSVCMIPLACGTPVPSPTPAEKRLLHQIHSAPDARIVLCDSSGPFCDQKRDSVLAFCLQDQDCQLYTVRKDRYPWLWETLHSEQE